MKASRRMKTGYKSQRFYQYQLAQINLFQAFPEQRRLLKEIIRELTKIVKQFVHLRIRKITEESTDRLQVSNYTETSISFPAP
jgi:uncharacterized protein (DUF1810 family)